MQRSLALSACLTLFALAACGGGPSASPDGGGGAGGGAPAYETDDDFPLPLAAGLAPTPPMGWNSWNKFACNITAAFVEQVADGMVSSGMKDAGYQFINIDDCWSQATRAADGTLQPDPVHFPPSTAGGNDGIQIVADYVHAKGLKLGIYGDRGTETCGHRAGSQGYEMQDAMTFAGWGVDYLKYDNCPDPGPNPGPIIEPMYQAMATALAMTGRPIVFSICAWSFYEWANVMGNLQRTTTDITNTWASIVANLQSNKLVTAYGGPSHWNDPDMLEVGNSDNGAGPVTDLENESHFSLWAIADAPLIAGNDLRDGHMTDPTKATLTNTEVIALNQDALGLPGYEVRESGDQSVWAKPLNANGARGVVLFNAGAAPADITVGFAEIGLSLGPATVRDLLRHADLGSFTDSYTAMAVPSHGTATLKIVGGEPARPRGAGAYLSDLTATYAANGLGPVERDTANGASDPGDGGPIKLRGQAFTKGLGMSAPAAVIYRLGKTCTSFSATVGVDDAAGGAGSVVFQVWADGTKLFDSGAVTGMSAAMPVAVDLTGQRRLKLMVTNAGDGSALDRADWADAKVDCAP
jgi:alpha-galactosidase